MHVMINNNIHRAEDLCVYPYLLTHTVIHIINNKLLYFINKATPFRITCLYVILPNRDKQVIFSIKQFQNVPCDTLQYARNLE